MRKVYNFSAGPAALPDEVLAEAASSLSPAGWAGCGISPMEMSHRGPEFLQIMKEAEAGLRDLLEVPENFKILFLQGGATAMNAAIPLNLAGPDDVIDFVHTGMWSGKALAEGSKYARAHTAASSEKDGFRSVPEASLWDLTPDAAYVHVCTNETVHGNRMHSPPETGNVPLIADMSSEILSRPVDFSKYALVYAGAQKNLGPAGVTVVIVREDLLGRARPECPSVFDFAKVSEAGSMFNTPPCWAIYICSLVFKWLKRRGGVARAEKDSIEKAGILYELIDKSAFYRNVVRREDRSLMNVPFFLADSSLDALFIGEAAKRGIVQIKGHRSVGGMRASLYNAVSLEAVRALAAFMAEFEGRAASRAR